MKLPLALIFAAIVLAYLAGASELWAWFNALLLFCAAMVAVAALLLTGGQDYSDND
jgi:hypothetical protein